MNSDSDRRSACICVKDHIKRVKETWNCRCTARIYKKQYLDTTQVHISQVKLSETYKLDPQRTRKFSETDKQARRLLRKHLLSTQLTEDTEEVLRIVKLEPAESTLDQVTDSAESLESEVLKAPSVSLASLKSELKQPVTPIDQEALVILSESYRGGMARFAETDAEWANTIKGLVTVLGSADLYECFAKGDFIKTFEYQGFDVVKFREAFGQLARKLTSRHKIWIAVGQTEDASGAVNFGRLITYLITIYNLRGNNIKAIIDGLPEEGRAVLDNLATVLEIKRRVVEKQGEARNTMTVTLARIAAAFPIHAVSIVKSPAFKRKVIDLSDIGIDQETPIEKVLAHPMTPSILTSAAIKNGHVWITFLAAIRLNKVIGKKTGKDDFESLWTFHKAILCSKAVGEDIKTKFWETLSVPDEYVDAARTVVVKLISSELKDELTAYAGCDRK
uniref:Nucleocapsid n=1 Tax=Salarivirus Mos8CM0 TaxID=1925501 RepID=A0A1L4A1S0_9VIRU|nr:nucleocapsid [Salarivirus Mos8CM0]